MKSGFFGLLIFFAPIFIFAQSGASSEQESSLSQNYGWSPVSAYYKYLQNQRELGTMPFDVLDEIRGGQPDDQVILIRAVLSKQVITVLVGEEAFIYVRDNEDKSRWRILTYRSVRSWVPSNNQFAYDLRFRQVFDAYNVLEVKGESGIALRERLLKDYESWKGGENAPFSGLDILELYQEHLPPGVRFRQKMLRATAIGATAVVGCAGIFYLAQLLKVPF